MSFKIILCVLIIIWFFTICEGLNSNDTGVCEAKISVRKTRVKSYLVALNKRCGKKKCTAKRTKTEAYSVTRKQTVCCNGFQYSSDTDACLPLCSTGCEGGRCIAPDLCHCDPPAVLNNNNTCVTTCEPPSVPVNNTCVTTCEPPSVLVNNTCVTTCDPPSVLVNDTCVTQCDPPCINGHCTNNTCICNPSFTSHNVTHCYRCDPGFNIDEHFVCSPICTTKCTNGRCSAPEVCTCDDGHKKLDEFTCEPQCEVCVNSKCVSPNTCECFHGYERVNVTHCVPKCDNCDNGQCVGPNQCECDSGFKRTEGGCVQECLDCVNGFCSAPKVCTCNEGYAKNDDQKCTKVCPIGFHGDNDQCVLDSCKTVKITAELS